MNMQMWLEKRAYDGTAPITDENMEQITFDSNSGTDDFSDDINENSEQ